MIKVEIKNNISFPSFILEQNDLLNIANKIVIPLLQDGIDRGVGVDGSMFPINEPATVMRKAKKGLGRKVLIETGKLYSSFYSKIKGKNSVIVSLNSSRKEIGGYLQNDGIRTKSGKKYYKFFGITDGMREDAMNVMRNKVKESCKKFNGGKTV